MWYVLAAIIPATRIETGPPPGGAGTGAVERPYCVVSPNSTVTVVSAGSVIVQLATSGWLVGWTEADRSAGSVADDMGRTSSKLSAVVNRRAIMPQINSVGESLLANGAKTTDKRFGQLTVDPGRPRRDSEASR
jgi:hypothetical protein